MKKAMRALVMGSILLGGVAVPAAPQSEATLVALRGEVRVEPAEGSLLAKPAKLDVSEVPLRKALELLSTWADVSVAFSPNSLPEERLVDCRCKNLRISEALDRILLGTELGYVEMGNQIAIVKRAPSGLSASAPKYSELLISSVAGGPSNFGQPGIPRELTSTVSEALPQEQVISGRIVDIMNGSPIAGAQVIVVGTQTGTLTNEAGRFRISGLTTPAVELEVIMMGYRTARHLARAGDTDVRIELAPSAVDLDELVVTGTAGAASRRELGNSIATMSTRQLDLIPASSISEVLQGQITGLQFFANDGQVGTGNTIVLRGVNSVTQGFEPLVYIDGVRVNNPAFQANTFTGVAAAGNPGAEGAQTSPKPLDALNRADIERIEVIRGAAATTLYGTEAAGGVIQIFTKRGMVSDAPIWTVEGTLGTRFQVANGLGPVIGNDPTYLGLKPLLRTGLVRGIGGSVRGGTEGFRYAVFGSFDFEEGVVPNNSSGRYTVRGNFGFRPHSTLMVDLNTSFASRSSEFAETGDNTYGLLLNVFRGTNSYTGDNPEMLFDIDNRSTDDRFVGGVTFVHTPVSSIVNRLTAGVDYTNAFNRQTIPFAFPILPSGRREVNRWTSRILSLDYVGTWSANLGQNASSVFSWGGQFVQNLDHAQFATAERFGGPGEKTIRSGAVTRADETQLTVVNAGFFLQEVFGLRNRLFFTAGIRGDGNSAFGESLGLQFYPKLSSSWVVSEEEFWPESFGVLRLRAAIGESGKAPGAFDAVRTWEPVPGYDGQPGVSPSTVGNPELGPERTRELELGFESVLLSERVFGEFTWFRSVTRDALFAVPAPPSQGFLSSPLRNVGEFENRGIEVSLTTVPVQIPSFRWEVGGKYSTANSKVLDLGGSAPFNVGFAFLGQWVREGYPVVAAFGSQVTNPDELSDPIIELDAYLGPIYPTRHYSFSSTVTFRSRLTLYVLGQGSGGNVSSNNMARQGVNRGRWPECYDRMDHQTQTAIWRARCRVNSQLAVWTRPADILRLRTVSLAWQLPESLVPGASAASVMIAAQNLWRSQGHTGLDPELNRGGRYSVAPARYEYYQLPPPQGVTLTFRATF